MCNVPRVRRSRHSIAVVETTDSLRNGGLGGNGASVSERIILCRGPFMNLPRTLGELRKSEFSEQKLQNRKVKDELRDNLIVKLRSGETIFPGIIGYDDTV